jgi:hypothetical protein
MDFSLKHVAREARADKVGSHDRESRVAQRELNAIGWSAVAGVILKVLPRIMPRADSAEAAGELS